MTPIPLLLRQWGRSIVLVAVLAAVVTAVLTTRLPRQVEVVQTLTIPVPDRPSTNEYEFDGYYALQATEIFADTLAGWLTSADLVAEAYDRAAMPRPATSVRRLARVFVARKVSGQLVELRFQTAREADARRLLQEVDRLIAERAVAFNESGRSALAFSIHPQDPLILPVQRSVPIRALVAALVAAGVFTSIVVFADAWKIEDHHAA